MIRTHTQVTTDTIHNNRARADVPDSALGFRECPAVHVASEDQMTGNGDIMMQADFRTSRPIYLNRKILPSFCDGELTKKPIRNRYTVSSCQIDAPRSDSSLFSSQICRWESIWPKSAPDRYQSVFDTLYLFTHAGAVGVRMWVSSPPLLPWYCGFV